LALEATNAGSGCRVPELHALSPQGHNLSPVRGEGDTSHRAIALQAPPSETGDRPRWERVAVPINPLLLVLGMAGKGYRRLLLFLGSALRLPVAVGWSASQEEDRETAKAEHDCEQSAGSPQPHRSSSSRERKVMFRSRWRITSCVKCSPPHPERDVT